MGRESRFIMPPVARLLSRILAAVLCLIAASPLLASDRFVGWLSDGTKVSASRLPAWPVPGSPTYFDGRNVLGDKNPVRLLRDRQASVSLKGPYLVLANGDVLTGACTQLEPPSGQQGEPLWINVQLESLLPISGTMIPVRTDRVTRIVGSSDSSLRAHEPPPGTVELTSGRRLVARSIRWKEYGLAMLTEGGIVEANYSEIAEAVFPGVDVTTAVVDDNLLAGGTSATSIARFQMMSGAVLTASRVSREMERSRRRGRTTNDVFYYVQPAWAAQPIAVPEPEIAWCGYRAADEAPLSLLKAELLSSRGIVGPAQKWSRNTSSASLLPASGSFEADLGLATHSHSELAFDLPSGASNLITAVGLDQAVGQGGCVRCKIVAENPEGKVLWDSGILLGAYGPKPTGQINVAGLSRVVLVTEFAHDDRPKGADPFDLRDQVVWLAPLVKMDLQAAHPQMLLSMLGALPDWELKGDGWKGLAISSRWNTTTLGWDLVVSLPRGVELKLARKLKVTAASDIVELRTVCPVELEEHDFHLIVDGQPVDWLANTDRDRLRAWVARYYSKNAYRNDPQDSLMGDRLAYWWNLKPWRGKEVALELTLAGSAEQNEIAWRGFAVRSAIANLAAEEESVEPDVLLSTLKPTHLAGPRETIEPAVNAVPDNDLTPVRFLGQQFTGGWGMRRESVLKFAIEPDYTKFVAVIGGCRQIAGPLQVLIDDRPVWETPLVNNLLPAEQIEIDIPPGSKTLTFTVGANGSYDGAAAFVNAGFMLSDDQHAK